MPVTPAPTNENPPVPSADVEPVDQSPTRPVAAPQRPEGVPDSFWDEKIGLRTNELVADYNTLAAERDRAAAAFKDFPEKAEDAGKFYTLPEDMLPEGVKLPDGLKFEPNAALLGAALPILHKHKVSADAFQELTRAFNAYELGAYQKSMTEFAEDGKKLGEAGPTRRKAVADGLAALVGPEKAGFIDPAAITSGAVEFFEAILAKVADQGNVVPLRKPGDAPLPAPDKPLIDRLADTMYSKKVS